MLMESWRANRADHRDLQKQLAEAYIQHQFELAEAGALSLSEESQEEDAEPAAFDAGQAIASRSNGESLVSVGIQSLNENARRQVRLSRARFAIIRQVNAARLETLVSEANDMLEKIKEYSKVSALLQSRNEELQRRAELVDAMGTKLARWELDQSGGNRVMLIQPAIIDRASGE